MVRPRKDLQEQTNRAELFKKLGRDVDEAFESSGIQKNAFQKAGIKLHPTTISRMIKGDDEYQWNDNNFLRLLRGFLLFDICEDRKKAKYWFQKFCKAKGYEGLSLEEYCDEHGEDGEAVIIELGYKEPELKQEARIEKQKYRRTRHELLLIGREQDIRKILNKFRNEGIHFLVLVGLPGVGKTELARQVEIEAQAQEYFVRKFPLAQVRSSDEVIKSLTNAIKGMPTQRKILFILDNCEQINGFTQAIYAFLKTHTHVTILATSQRTEPNRNEYPVEPLKVPETIHFPPKKLQTYDAVKLFLESANRNCTGDKKVLTITENNAETTPKLCIALGGIPLLLIQVAALWIKSLKGVEGAYKWLQEGLLQKLEISNPDNPQQNTLDAVIGRSYDILKKDDERQQTLIRWLAIFPTKCSIAEVMALGSVDNLPTEIPAFIKIVNDLRECLLLTFENEQIEIGHKTLRDYARRNLLGEDAERMIDQFINFYALLLARDHNITLSVFQHYEERYYSRLEFNDNDDSIGWILYFNESYGRLLKQYKDEYGEKYKHYFESEIATFDKILEMLADKDDRERIKRSIFESFFVR